MRLLLDQNLPVDSAKLLRKLGYDAVHTREIGEHRTADADLISLALSSERYIATMDKDFPAIVATRYLKAPSIILIRLKDPDEFEICEVIHRVCATCAENLQSGSIVTVEADSIRIRTLPVHLLS
jgi:predicted nuclease of predicted toxin-antitoxin system